VWHSADWNECDNWHRQGAQADAVVTHHCLAARNQVCPHCHARFWQGERIECCFKGSIIFEEQVVPESLRQAILNPTVRTNIRQYNMALAMASVGHKNKSLPDGTFVLSGKSYHRIGALTPGLQNAANFAQIYILDTLDATARRQELFGDRLQDAALSRLHDQLLLFNPFVRQFR
jgi:hypothetical protein